MYTIIFQEGDKDAITLPQQISVDEPTDVQSCLAHIASKRLGLPNVILIEKATNVFDVFKISGPVAQISVIPFVGHT